MTLFNKIEHNPTSITFPEVIAHIDSNFDFTPTRFVNGNTINEAGQNNGSCKIFAFAQLNKFTVVQTLALFGNYYRIDVLENPEGTDHQNIRNFIKTGWEGIQFEGTPLSQK